MTWAPYTKGRWHDFVVHVKWTHLPTGFMKIWINGELKLDYAGPTYLDYGAGSAGPYFKMGNYKGTFTWKGTMPRVLYFDEYRMGNANPSYKEVSPGPNSYESFDYATGAGLADANGGLGWAGSTTKPIPVPRSCPDRRASGTSHTPGKRR
ncbi:MAG: heparin lyase I family protein [Chthoniobacterales bacterium]|nr:heparin lyase I family protein [Chthoniobacterales bacterium]